MRALFWINDGDYNTTCFKIAHSLSTQTLCVQLAEECAELAQAALKVTRNIGKVNKSRKTPDESLKDLKEEIGDVLNCLNVMQIEPDCTVMKNKVERWLAALEENRADIR